MYEPDEVSISESHHNLLAEHGDLLGVVLTVNLDAAAIVGVHTFHEFEGTVVSESVSPNPTMGRYDSYYRLLNYFGDGPEVIRKHMSEVIDMQENSDDETQFTWELVTGTGDVMADTELRETLERVVGPERLDPPFDVPDDEPVARLDVGYEQHDIIVESNNRYGYASVRIERFRGETFIIGLTQERAETLANGCHKLQQEYSEMGLYESAESAERVEGDVLRAVPA